MHAVQSKLVDGFRMTYIERWRGRRAEQTEAVAPEL
jgi:hypothetical protein